MNGIFSIDLMDFDDAATINELEQPFKSDSNDSFYSCLTVTHKHGFEKEIFWISGVTMAIVAFIGLIGNVINLIVLCQPEMKKFVFYQLLSALACFDIIFIIFYGGSFSYKSLACYPLNPLVEDIAFPFIKFGFLGSNYMAIGISIERYLKIRSIKFGSKRPAWIFIAIASSISVGGTIPSIALSKNFFVNGTLSPKAKGIWSNISHEYSWDVWIELFLNTIIPLVTLLTFNGLIIIHILRRNFKAKKMNTEIKIGRSTRILLWTVFFIFILNSPRLIYKGLLYFAPHRKNSWYWVRPCVRLALVSNSCINFIIYAMVSSKYRGSLR